MVSSTRVVDRLDLLATYHSISAWAMERPNVARSRTRTVPAEPPASVGSCATWLMACVPTTNYFRRIHTAHVPASLYDWCCGFEIPLFFLF